MAIGSYNLQNLTTGQYNTPIGQCSLTMGSSNIEFGYEASGSYQSINGIQMGSNNIAICNFSGSGAQTIHRLSQTLFP